MKSEYENKLIALYYRAMRVMSRNEIENIPILVDIGNDISAHHFNLDINDVQMSHSHGHELPPFPLRSLSEDLVDLIIDSVEIAIYDAEKEKERR